MLGNHFFWPISYTVLNEPQDTLGPFGCKDTLQTHIELSINRNPQIHFCRAVCQPLVPQSIHPSRITSSQVQNPSVVLAKFLSVTFVHLSPMPSPVDAGRMNSSTPISHTCKGLSVVTKISFKLNSGLIIQMLQ